MYQLRKTQPRARGETQGVRETGLGAPRAGQVRHNETGTGTCSTPSPRAEPLHAVQSCELQNPLLLGFLLSKLRIVIFTI